MHAPLPRPAELRICTGDALHWLKQMRDNSINCVVAKALNRHCILIELNPAYVAIARKRLQL